MHRLTIKARLMAMAGLFAMFMVVVGVLGLQGMRANNGALEVVYRENLTKTADLSRVIELMRDNRIQLLLALQHNPITPHSNLHDHPITFHTEKVTRNIAEITATWQRYKAMPQSEDGKRLVERFEETRARFVKDGLLPTADAIMAGRFDDATRLTLEAVNPLFATAADSMESLFKNEQFQARKKYDDAVSRYRTTRNLMIGGIIGILALGFFLSFPIIRSITRGAELLAEVSARVADGDLTARADIKSHDELGEIAGSFNRMADAFHGVIAKVRETSVQVAAAAHQLYSASEQMATGTEEMAAQTGTVAVAGEEMAATSTDIARNCVMVAETSQRASERAMAGAQVVQRTVSGMSRIAERVKETAETVESLGSRSDQIGAIIGTIEDIADQTNLLALNAAIEAARAGEQGRGFAVVADEVRALAERTTKATREIGAMIKAIQDETRGAVAAMAEGVREVENGTCEASRSGDALNEILEEINEVAMQVGQIATAAEEQTATTHEISNNIQQITMVVQETAKGTQESASSSSQLSKLAEELQGMVERFRLAG